MRVRTSPVSKSTVVNMFVSSSEKRKYTYFGDDGVIGRANYFSFDIGNYFSNPITLSYKVYVTDIEGNDHYVVGSASEYETLAVSTDLDTKEFNLDNIAVASITFEFDKAAGGNRYSYIDNFTLQKK